MDNESILNSIKKMLGLDTEYHNFDLDLIIHINSVISILVQMGVIEQAIFINDESETWAYILGEGSSCLEMVKSYMLLKVRMQFDPPTGGAADACNRMISEYEWRLHSESNYHMKDEGITNDI